MSETTTADIRAGFIECGLGDGSYIDQDDVRVLNAREFDAWLEAHDAEVERAAAEKALTDAAKGWREYTHTAPTSAPCAEWWLLGRAEAYRRERGER